MFNNTKYTKWYNNIIISAQKAGRIKTDNLYFESHHIIPKKLGGSNKKSNRVLLTAKEHYICHALLPKMCVDPKHQRSMAYAYLMMSNWNSISTRGHRYQSNIYRILKEAYIAKIAGDGHPLKGIKWSDDRKLQHSIMCRELKVNVGAIRSPETRALISATRIENGTAAGKNNPMFGRSHSTESKNQMSSTKKQIIQADPEAHKRKAIAANPKTRRVITDKGEIFPSLSEAGRAYGYAGAQGVRSKIRNGLWHYL